MNVTFHGSYGEAASIFSRNPTKSAAEAHPVAIPRHGLHQLSSFELQFLHPRLSAAELFLHLLLEPGKISTKRFK